MEAVQTGSTGSKTTKEQRWYQVDFIGIALMADGITQ